MRMYTVFVKRDVEGIWRWTPVVGAMVGVGVCDLVRGEVPWCGAAAELLAIPLSPLRDQWSM